VVSIETVGASGAYYVASASDKIYADSGSIVGSIGVIAQWVNYGDLLKWAKLKDVVLKTENSKTPATRPAISTPNEQAYMQSLIDNMFGQFVKAVSDRARLEVRGCEVDRQRQSLDRRAGHVDEAIDRRSDFERRWQTLQSVGIQG